MHLPRAYREVEVTPEIEEFNAVVQANGFRVRTPRTSADVLTLSEMKTLTNLAEVDLEELKDEIADALPPSFDEALPNVPITGFRCFAQDRRKFIELAIASPILAAERQAALTVVKNKVGPLTPKFDNYRSSVIYAKAISRRYIPASEVDKAIGKHKPHSLSFEAGFVD